MEGPPLVVQGLIALALAGPTGGLFGLAYGTAIRVGYEIIYPLLFDQIARDLKEGRNTGEAQLSQNTEIVIGKMNKLYTGIGGLEANAFGINTGIKNALKQIDNDPELLELIKKNSNLLSQNITVNLSGTGLIDEQGLVVSKPPSGGLSNVELVEAQHIVTEKLRKLGDQECVKAYGRTYGIAGFDSDGKHVSCQQVQGGRVVSRRTWPKDIQENIKKQMTEAEKEALTKVLGIKITDLRNIEQLHQRWAKTSTQSLQLEVAKLIRDRQSQIAVWRKLPVTIQLRRPTGIKGIGKPTITQIANPARAKLGQKIQRELVQMLDMQKYLNIRKSGNITKLRLLLRG